MISSLFLALVLFPQTGEEYYLDRGKISLDDIVDMGGKIYVRAKRLKKDWQLLWRPTLDGTKVGVYREGRGGGALKIGRGRHALIHTGDVYLSLDSIQNVLNTRVVRKPNRTEIHSRKRTRATDPLPKRTSLGPGDRMIDFEFPLVRNPKKSHRLSKRNDKRTVLLLWSSWDASREKLSKWQDLHVLLRRKGVTLVAVALDAQGPSGPERYVPRRVTYPVVIDRHWRTRSAFDAKALPRWVLVDEWGFIRATGATPGPEILEAVEKLEKPKRLKYGAWISTGPTRSKDIRELLKAQDSLSRRLALSRALLREGKADGAAAEARKVAQAAPKSWEVAIHLAAALWADSQNQEGVRVLSDFLKWNRSALFLRPQKWSVEFPEKMQKNPLDRSWMKEQGERELKGG